MSYQQEMPSYQSIEDARNPEDIIIEQQALNSFQLIFGELCSQSQTIIGLLMGGATYNQIGSYYGTDRNGNSLVQQATRQLRMAVHTRMNPDNQDILKDILRNHEPYSSI